MRHGKARAENRGLSKIEKSGMQRQAQKTSSRLDKATATSLANAISNAKLALESTKSRPQIYAEFPRTKVENSKLIFEITDMNFRYTNSAATLWQEPINLTIRGPTKLAIEGKNGSGKSTLIKLLTKSHEISGEMSGKIKFGEISYFYIDQSLRFVDQKKSVLENVETNSNKDRVEIRNLLAQFLFSGEKVHQQAATLSGGQQLRLALAMALFSDPAPQLLILDEPTNYIDLSNLEFLEVALEKFKGALIVVSHDTTFLEKIGIDYRLRLR